MISPLFVDKKHKNKVGMQETYPNGSIMLQKQMWFQICNTLQLIMIKGEFDLQKVFFRRHITIKKKTVLVPMFPNIN